MAGFVRAMVVITLAGSWFMPTSICVGKGASSEDPLLKLVAVNATLPTAVVVPRALYDDEDAIYVIGGRPGQDKLIKYLLGSDSVEVVGTFLNISRGAALLMGGNVVHFGGVIGPATPDPIVTDEAYSVSLEDGSCILVGRLPTPLRSIARCTDPGTPAHVYLFGGYCNDTTQSRDILQYDPVTQKIEPVATMPESLYGAGAFWDSRSKIAYIFGGGGSHQTSEIHLFDPHSNSNSSSQPNKVTKLAHMLAAPVIYPCAVFGFDEAIYMVRTFSTMDLVAFNPISNESRRISVDVHPLASLTSIGCTYVSKLARLYVFGGEYTTFEGSRDPVTGAGIYYIDMSAFVVDPSTLIGTDRRKDPWTTAYVGGAIAILILICLAFSGLVLLRRRNGRRVIDAAELKNFRIGLPNGRNGVPHLSPTQSKMETAEHLCPVFAALATPFDKRFEITRRKFTIDKSTVLGTGEYGKVYAGTLRTTQIAVAIKVPYDNCPEPILVGLLKELKIMSCLQHENLVRLLGANTSRAAYGNVYIIMEFCSHGSIEQFLQRSGCDNVDFQLQRQPQPQYVQMGRFGFPDLLRWSKEVAMGMEFLASRKIVHRDLAARNILLTATLKAKISDFGLSRQLYGNPAYQQKSPDLKLPCRWMAVECFSGKFSTESDVWAYAILAWEIFSFGKVPYTDIHFAEASQFAELLRGGLRITEPGHTTPEIFGKLNECWHGDPKARPSFTELKDFFSILLDQTLPLSRC